MVCPFSPHKFFLVFRTSIILDKKLTYDGGSTKYLTSHKQGAWLTSIIFYIRNWHMMEEVQNIWQVTNKELGLLALFSIRNWHMIEEVQNIWQVTNKVLGVNLKVKQKNEFNCVWPSFILVNEKEIGRSMGFVKQDICLSHSLGNNIILIYSYHLTESFWRQHSYPSLEMSDYPWDLIKEYGIKKCQWVCLRAWGFSCFLFSQWITSNFREAGWKWKVFHDIWSGTQKKIYAVLKFLELFLIIYNFKFFSVPH